MDLVYINDTQVFNFVKFANGQENKCELKTNYAKPIQLERKMECCLIDMSFPRTPYNYKIEDKKLAVVFLFDFPGLRVEDMPKGINYVTEPSTEFKRPFIIKTFDPKERYIKKIKYDLNYKYPNFEELTDHITSIINNDMNKMAKSTFNEWMPDSFSEDGKENDDIEFQPLSIEFNFNSNVVHTNIDFKVQPGIIKIRKKGQSEDDPAEEIAKFIFYFNYELHFILGLEVDTDPLKRFDKFFQFKTIQNLGNVPLTRFKNRFKNNILFLHSDIIKTSYFNNNRSNILRSLTFHHYWGLKAFENKIFIPIRFDEIDSILLSIRDSENDIIYFDEEFISITLLMRPIELS